uniref:MULE transposase domain-containing protein n=1 Tax=Hordeum vulgare subsp. vulgare TaxID=112509 RepID=A0A8I6YRB1_HORVV
MVCSSQIKEEKTHCIRQIMLPHTCGTTTDTSRINSTWLAKEYEDEIRSDPSMSITALIDAVQRRFGIEISRHMAYRAKNKALEVVEGDGDRQYLCIRDYLQTVMEKNPGSRCHVWTIRPINKPEKNPRFHGLFFGLHAQIEGFKNGCRPFIGIDGCFLKLGNGAQVLAATARDGNNNFYPLVFGVVGTEDTATWSWFLNQLKYALGGTTGQFGTYTFMSDRQKGLLAAVHLVFPHSSHRYCLRHIYANFQSAGYKGGDLKKLVDAAAYAFDKCDFDVAMEELRKEDKDAWEWMCNIPPKHWARHALDTHCKTDLVVNNISEVFNSYILKVRDKPIVTMIDSIRTKLMPRYASRREGVEHVQWEITPTYAERLEWEKRNARWCTAVCAKKGLWQVTNTPRTYEVNLTESSGCFKWDLTGIPCKHDVCAIYKAKEFPEDYVSDFFKKPMYKEAYQKPHISSSRSPWMDENENT